MRREERRGEELKGEGKDGRQLNKRRSEEKGREKGDGE